LEKSVKSDLAREMHPKRKGMARNGGELEKSGSRSVAKTGIQRESGDAGDGAKGPSCGKIGKGYREESQFCT